MALRTIKDDNASFTTLPLNDSSDQDELDINSCNFVNWQFLIVGLLQTWLEQFYWRKNDNIFHIFYLKQISKLNRFESGIGNLGSANLHCKGTESLKLKMVTRNYVKLQICITFQQKYIYSLFYITYNALSRLILEVTF